MKKQNSTRKSLMLSAVALLCCFVMLLGTTYAWFTDTVTSAGNTIQSGSLKIDLLHKTGEDKWTSVKETPDHKVFDYDKWEPGFTAVEMLKVVNLGTLALQYKLALSIAPGSEKTGPNGENLADVILVYYTNTDEKPADYAAIKSAWTYAGTLSEVMNRPATFIGGQLKEQNDEQVVTIALHMDEDAGNEYQNLSVGDIFVNLVATQWTYESDAFDQNYDKDATFPGEFSASATVSVTDGAVDQATTVGEQDGIHADIPTGVKMANGATELTLDIKPMSGSQANITLDNGETKKSYDIHIDGMSEDNTVPVQITLPGFMKKGLNTTSVELYHVENGQTVAMTLVDNPVNHNEFSYDPATGDVVVAMATFSEVVAVENVANPWDGTTATAYPGIGTEADPYLISNAEQFAYFRNQVDGGKDFKDEFVKLNGDIDLNKKNFDPIGWGYVNIDYNRDGKAGCVFMGTFDGNNKTIRNLYQNGWDLEASTGTVYTYTNCGFGLFAAAADATFMNLTITGANIVAECVEMGILVGLSQGDCTYDNIKVYNSKIANYQRPAGGLIGEVSPVDSTKENPETTTITNVTIGSDVVVGSLWGDFDAPVGGVIGARWDDANTTEVVMENVTVAARLDVYNDVTSSYQWYAYRRAGMLIGNTEQVADDGRTAEADFLTCVKDSEGNDTVKVYYGNWVNYHYCEFNNHEPRWPFVRVEAGENCSAFSNPRWGVPNGINGIKVTPDNHTAVGDDGIHQNGDDCMVLLAFNQLYGGGQGVYGQATHAGVEVVTDSYSVTYIDRGTIVAQKYLSNANAYTVGSDVETPTRTDGEYSFKAWVNAGGTPVEIIPKGNVSNYTLYDSWDNIYTARFVDQEGNVIYEEEFTNSKNKLDYVPGVPAIDGGYKGAWSEYDLTTATGDITIHPVYNANDGIVKLTPVDNEPKDGIVDYYQVTSVEENDNNVNIVIPSSFNGKPVMEIADGAFAEFDNITTVRIPTSITSLGADAFANEENKAWYQGGTLKYEQITFLYEGTYAQWQEIEKDANWDRYVGQGSRIYFLADGTYSEETANNGIWSAADRVWSDPVAGTYSN